MGTARGCVDARLDEGKSRRFAEKNANNLGVQCSRVSVLFNPFRTFKVFNLFNCVQFYFFENIRLDQFE